MVDIVTQHTVFVVVFSKSHYKLNKKKTNYSLLQKVKINVISIGISRLALCLKSV